MARRKYEEKIFMAYLQRNKGLKGRLFATGAFDEIAAGYFAITMTKLLNRPEMTSEKLIKEYMDAVSNNPVSEALKYYKTFQMGKIPK